MIHIKRVHIVDREEKCTKRSDQLSLFDSSIDHLNVHRRGNFGSNFTGPEVTSKLLMRVGRMALY